MFGTRLHDLWIILSWTGILTGLMIYTFFHRSCAGFTQQNDLTDPCQSFVDLGIIFVVALGAGLALADERVAIIGFLFVHLLASLFFVVALATPAVLGLQDPVLTDTLLARSLLVALRYAFPFAIFSSFIGSFLGLYLEDKLRLSKV